MAYLTQAELEYALSPQTVLAIFDDTNTGVVNAAAIAAVLERASAEADSWLKPVYPGDYPLPPPIPAMVKELALNYAVAFSFERHPDYVRSFGEQPRAERWKRADELGQRIQSAIQRIPGLNRGPKNVGAVVYDQGPRTMTDSLDGTSNAGDF